MMKQVIKELMKEIKHSELIKQVINLDIIKEIITYNKFISFYYFRVHYGLWGC